MAVLTTAAIKKTMPHPRCWDEAFFQAEKTLDNRFYTKETAVLSETASKSYQDGIGFTD